MPLNRTMVDVNAIFEETLDLYGPGVALPTRLDGGVHDCDAASTRSSRGSGQLSVKSAALVSRSIPASFSRLRRLVESGQTEGERCRPAWDRSIHTPARNDVPVRYGYRRRRAKAGPVSTRRMHVRFIKRLHARFEREGFVIPFPVRTIASRDRHTRDNEWRAGGAPGIPPAGATVRVSGGLACA